MNGDLMKTFFSLLKWLLLPLCILSFGSLAHAQAGTGTHNLDGTSVDWTYNNSDTRMVVTFSEGLAKYKWVAGARKGNSDSEIPYSSREISPGIYLMSWI